MNTIEDYKRILMQTQDECLRLTFENRKLEQERNEAREHLREIKEYGTEEINAAVDLRQKLASALVERDEAQNALKNHTTSEIHSCHNECQMPICVLRRERDEAMEDATNYYARINKLIDFGNKLADECDRILGLGLHQNTLLRFKSALESWRKNN